jgi:hypothetical protein
MVQELPTNRAYEYRKRAEEARSKADGMANRSARESMLQIAAQWEQMAAHEDAKLLQADRPTDRYSAFPD